MRHKYNYILMDLDGTIIDSMQGITRSARYALRHFGIHVDNLEELRPFIGPPLKYSFMEFYGFSDVQSDAAVQKYRERYAAKGVHENTVYEGMERFLQHMRQCGKTCLLATSKASHFAEQILTELRLRHYFAFIGGSGLDGSRSTKADVIRYVLDEQGITDTSEVVMVGDRKYDVAGARQVGVDSIGVLYGYGSKEELQQAGATHIVRDVHELERVLCPHFISHEQKCGMPQMEGRGSG